MILTDENVAAGIDAEGVDWGEVAPDGRSNWVQDGPEQATELHIGRESYPEHPDNPHNHRFTLSVTGDKAPMMVIRANTAAEMTAAINELEAYGVWANVGAAHASMRAQGALGAGLGPVSPVAPQAPAQTGFPAPPAPQGGATPPPFGPNVSVPGAPGYQGPPVATGQPGFPTPPPATGGWGGGQQQQRSQEKPRPAGWLMVDVPFNDKDRFKAMREAGKDYFKGKVQWGGRGVYWLEPSVAQYVAQQGFPVTQ